MDRRRARERAEGGRGENRVSMQILIMKHAL